ncbi:gag poly protein, partial [Trichoderma arundinaceum]
RREKQLGEVVKPAPPEKFMGDPAKIQKFFIDMRTHFEYYYPVTFAPDKVHDRVQFAGTRLGGPAATWFDPILEDFRKNTPDKRDEQTQTIFLAYENFEKQLQKTFGSTNEEREAENQLRMIKQKGALAKHTVNFIQLLTKVKWTEETKKDVYYQSVKPEVKDELYKIKREDRSFIDYTQDAIDIDNRQWERKQERKTEKNGSNQNFQNSPRQGGNRNTANQGRRRDDYVASSNDTRPGRMDLSSIICYN